MYNLTQIAVEFGGKQKGGVIILHRLLCGAGGSRTLVQTGKPYAFYTLIPAFGFRAAARPGPPTATLSSKISSHARGRTRLFPI